MDGFTQGALGAAVTQAFYGDRLGRWALPIGWFAGMLPDADIFIRNSADPLWGWTFHRTVTHGLAFVPIGALLACLPFLLARSLRPRWREVYGAAFVAYATHAPLDAATTYGTVLLWPFDDLRVSWDLIGIIDPIFTLFLLVGVIFSTRRRSAGPARVGVALAALYLVLCVIQHERAVDVQAALVESRSHEVRAARVVPTVINIVLYRSVYMTEGGYIYADALRVPFLGPDTVRVGDSAPVFDPVAEGVYSGAVDPERLRRDLSRFAWFTGGYWARTPGNPQLIGDMRITGDPAMLAPLWGIVIDPLQPVPVTRGVGAGRDTRAVGALWREIWGLDERHVPAP
ncbi:MAG: metal-dependent hydrolase [Haliangiales bacterium]